MSIVLTQEEKDFLDKCFNGHAVDESLTTPREGENEGVEISTMSTGRTAHFIYHYDSDSITVFAVDEAPIPEPITKLTDFLTNNPDVKSLLGM